MKFFKHFTDAHRGRSIQSLFDEMGHMGPCSYWILVEMCAEKLDQKADEKLTDSDCEFHFHQRILRQNLRISPTNLRRLLDICRTLGLLSYEIDGNSVRISMRKLLECIDRRRKTASEKRPKADTNASLEVDKEQEQEREKEKERKETKRSTRPRPIPFPKFDEAFGRYPLAVKGGDAEDRYRKQIQSEDDHRDLLRSIENYKAMLALPKNDYRSPKQTFAAYLGTKSSGFFWRDFINWTPPTPIVAMTAMDALKARLRAEGKLVEEAEQA